MYKGFLDRINMLVKAEYEKISAIYNFEHGPEYEIAVCRILRQFLPSKFSICRGHIVSEYDTTAGDDIIIYDANSFPNLRLLENDLSIKQYIPAESVYAYIELKHTLYLDTEDQQSLSKACKQVEAAKNIPKARKELTQFDGFNIGNNLTITPQKNWPSYKNPIFGAIISKNISCKDKINKINSEIFRKHLDPILETLQNKSDLIIAGDNLVALPVIGENHNPQIIESPFYINNLSNLYISETSYNIVFGLINLLRALNFISLTEMSYNNLIARALNI